MRAIKLLAALALVLCTSCAGLGKCANDRGNDFLDCFTALGGFGVLAPAFELHATDWVTTGAGQTQSWKWGIRGRETGTLECQQVCDPKHGPPLELAILGHSPTWEKEFEADGSLRRWYTYVSKSHWNEGWTDSERRVAKSILLFDVTSIPRFAYYRDGGGAHFEERKTIEALDIHVDATAALLLGPSFRLGFSPGQFADFVVGFFGLDIAGDDAETQQPKTPKGDKQ